MGRELVVVGASAGGVEALRDVVAGLPPDLPAAVLVVLHVAPHARSALPLILRRVATLPVDHAVDGEEIRPGQIYVAPPNRHLVVRDGRLLLGQGPRENGHRPAVDPLFRSASRWYGPGVIGVILSGTLDDGAAGLATIAARGGRVIVHDPDEALYDGMPTAAIRAVQPDAVVSSKKIGAYIAEWCREETAAAPPVDRELQLETDVAELDESALSDPVRPGTPAGVSCPDCSGAMFEIDTDTLRFRCRVGHAWSPEALFVEQAEEAEGALWVAVRSLEEKAALHRRLAQAARSRGQESVNQRQLQKADEAGGTARTIRQLLTLPLVIEEHADDSAGN
jgi:two-component system chemotaxis response regulator CheB